MTANLKGLIGKLNDTTRNTLEAAAGFCLARTHYDIEVCLLYTSPSPRDS